MKVTYLNHSGFLLELENCYIIFDYYRGELSPLNAKKDVFVFCSHVHGDHYNPKSPFLIGNYEKNDSIHDVPQQSWVDGQMSLF